MLHGVGTDILQTARMGEMPETDAFVRKTFTEAERREIYGKPSPMHSLCARFAGKEAVFKALGADPDSVRLNQIEILSDPQGAPHVGLRGDLAAWAEAQGVGQVHLSLSWEADYALAFAVAEKAALNL